MRDLLVEIPGCVQGRKADLVVVGDDFDDDFFPFCPTLACLLGLVFDPLRTGFVVPFPRRIILEALELVS
jgi:hypothetical protein